MELIFRLVLAICVLWAMMTFILVMHEYGHCWAMNKVGIKPDEISVGTLTIFQVKIGGVPHKFGLFPIVGFVASAGYMSAGVSKRAVVAGGGPLASVLLGVLFLAAGYVTQNWLIVICGQASLFLAVTNLIPLPPMDGWPLLEWALFKRGIVVREFTKRKLLAAGWVVIGIVIFLAML